MALKKSKKFLLSNAVACIRAYFAGKHGCCLAQKWKCPWDKILDQFGTVQDPITPFDAEGIAEEEVDRPVDHLRPLDISRQCPHTLDTGVAICSTFSVSKRVPYYVSEEIHLAELELHMISGFSRINYILTG